MLATMIPGLILSGCFYTEVNGPVVGATVLVERWQYRQDDSVRLAFSEPTVGPEYWAQMLSEEWHDWTSEKQLSVLGGTPVPKKKKINPNQLYLLSCNYYIRGQDYDSYRTKTLNDSPVTVEGALYAFATGEQILNQEIRLSTLTTAFYHYAKHYSSSKFILGKLNSAAKELVRDINADGSIDYSDVLIWSRQDKDSSFRGEISAIDELASNITYEDEIVDSKWIEVVGREGASVLTQKERVYDFSDPWRAADANIFGTNGVPEPHLTDKAMWIGDEGLAGTIYSLEWWGFYRSKDLPPDTKSRKFKLIFYAHHQASAPEPGEILDTQVIRSRVMKNPERGTFDEHTILSELEEFNGRSVYRYNAVLSSPLIIPENAAWISILELNAESGDTNQDFVLHASTDKRTGFEVVFKTQYGWLKPDYWKSPRRREPLVYMRLQGVLAGVSG